MPPSRVRRKPLSLPGRRGRRRFFEVRESSRDPRFPGKGSRAGVKKGGRAAGATFQLGGANLRESLALGEGVGGRGGKLSLAE